MADISKVTASDGTTYDLKDTTARSAIDDKMDKANPTGTGSLSLNRRTNTTIGTDSTTEGIECEASGDYSHAEGRFTSAQGYGSHAEGYNTVAGGAYQHVSGWWNIVDNNNTYAEIVGNGSSSALSNARTLDWLGNETIAGDLTFNSSTSLTSALSGKQATLVSGTNIKTINGASILGSGNITTPNTQPSNWHETTETDRTGTDWASTPTTENIELPNNSTKSVGTFQLTAGVWIVEVAVNFNSNANGRRVMGIAGTKDASDFGGTINMVSTRAVDGTNTVLSKTVLLYPSKTTRYHVVAFQNRGGGLYVYPRYRAIKIL